MPADVAHAPQLEQIADKMVTILQANLKGRLDALAAYWNAFDIAKWGAAIDLSAPPNESYFIGDTELISEFPAVVIDPIGTTFVSGPYRRHGHHPEENRVRVELYLVDDSDERTARKMMRYGLAVVEILQEESRLDDLCKGGRVESIDYDRGDANGLLFRVVGISVVYTVLTDD